MNELRRTLKTALQTSEELVLATVVKTTGNVYRRAGGRMLFTRDRWISGGVSAGCIEGELREQAWNATTDGPALLVFDTRSDNDIMWGYGMGCPGVIEVLVERFDPSGDLSQISLALEQRQSIRILTSLKGPNLGSRSWECGDVTYGSGDLIESNGEDVFVEDLPPGPRLVILGAGNDALPLDKMAREVGWITCVADHRAGLASVDRFPLADERITATVEDLPDRLQLDEHSFVVVMTHNYLSDLALIPTLLASETPYVGLVSSKQRADRLLMDMGLDRSAKFYSPVGLPSRAEGPEEIALTILAQLQGLVPRCVHSG